MSMAYKILVVYILGFLAIFMVQLILIIIQDARGEYKTIYWNSGPVSHKSRLSDTIILAFFISLCWLVTLPIFLLCGIGIVIVSLYYCTIPRVVALLVAITGKIKESQR